MIIVSLIFTTAPSVYKHQSSGKMTAIISSKCAKAHLCIRFKTIQNRIVNQKPNIFFNKLKFTNHGCTY